MILVFLLYMINRLGPVHWCKLLPPITMSFSIGLVTFDPRPSKGLYFGLAKMFYFHLTEDPLVITTGEISDP